MIKSLQPLQHLRYYDSIEDALETIENFEIQSGTYIKSYYSSTIFI